MRAMVVLILIAIALAGCMDSGPASASDAKNLKSDVDAGAGTGRIEGFVRDTEEFPVAGALVDIVSSANRSAAPLSLVSDANGHFLAKGLSPGKYFVGVGRLGYVSKEAKLVQVSADNTTTVTFTLEVQRILEPWHESLTYTVRFTNMACVVISPQGGCWLGTYGYYTANTSVKKPISENETGLVQTMIIEARWQSEIQMCKSGPRLELNSPETDGAGFWDKSPVGGSPMHLYIPREGEEANAMMSPERTKSNGGSPIETSGDWYLYSYPYAVGSFGTAVDFGCLTNQAVEEWWSIFYGAPAPDPTWSAFSP
jgi:hypothetical protein